MFVMVRGEAPLCYAEQEEYIRSIKSVVERGICVDGREGKGIEVRRAREWTTKARKRNKSQIITFPMSDYVTRSINELTALVTAFAPSRTAALSSSLTRGMIRPSNLSG